HFTATDPPLLLVPNTSPEGRGRCHVLSWNGYQSAEFIGERAVHAEADGEPRRGICTMKLIYRIEPRTVRADILPLLRSAVHHIEWLGKAGAEPDKLVGQFHAGMVPVGGHWLAAEVVHNDHTAGALEGQGADEIHHLGESAGVFGQLPEFRFIQIVVA